MWRQLIGGGGADDESPPGKIVEPTEHQASAPEPSNESSPSILGPRFDYLGRITSKFMEQVGAEEDDDEIGSDEGWEDGFEEAEEGWNDDDDDVESSAGGESEFLSTTQEHREVTGKIENVLQEIEEQELHATNSLVGDGDDGTSLSEDKEHQEIAVQEIRNEIGQLVDQTPSSVVEEKSATEELEKRTTFSPQLTTNHHLVDHTPAELDQEEIDPSVIALATVEDMTRNTNDEDIEGDHEEDYGPVVDQTPPTFSNVSSLAAHVASEADSICDDETDAAGVGAWGDDKHQGDDVALVDHTPSEIVDSPEKRDVGSVEVLASVAENSMTGGDGYGLVVDQTPVTPASHWARSESVVVQANDDLGTVDETTVARDEEVEDATLRDEEAPSETGNEDQLVDFIPSRAESRYGDGSTFAAADPSEVLSVVDGLAPDDENFGPVVDVTPPPLPPAQTAGEGSTVAFASPSVAVDDSDGEDDVPQEANGTWAGAENSEAPNPQSGNDDAVDNTQLVDFLPPVSENVRNDTTQVDVQSDYTIGGGQSLLLQGENPREDDFGPVVDQIPSGTHASQMSLASTATQLTYSEFQAIEKDDQLHAKSDDAEGPTNVFVDHLPIIEKKLPVDSTATIGRSLQSEEEGEEDEDEDATKFGPVVDHLPTSRASLAPSRGGSTVDALGAVSEVNSDEEEPDGWDDEISQGEASDATERQRVSKAKTSIVTDGDRSVSVRFDATADGWSSTRAVDHDHPTEENSKKEPMIVCSESSMNNSSINSYHDSRQGLGDKSFAEADTPPSTPYRRSSDPALEPPSEAIYLPQFGGSTSHHQMKNASIQYGCDDLEKALSVDPDAFVTATVRLKDGSEIKVDLRQLLHDETTRRKLLEEELKEAKALENSQVIAQEQDDVRVTQTLKKNLNDIEEERLILQDSNLSLKRDLIESQQMVRNLEAERDNHHSSAAAAIAEVKELKTLLATTIPSNQSDMQSELLELHTKLVSKSGECEMMMEKVSQLESRLRTAEESSARQAKETAELSAFMKQTVDSLRSQLSGSDDLLSNTEKARLVLEEKIRALESEVTNLRASGQQVAELQIRHERDLQEQYKLLDRKSADLSTLECLVASLQQEKSKLVTDLSRQRSLAEHSEALANELLAVARERDLLEKSLIESRSTMNKLQKLIEDQEAEKAKIDDLREKEVSELREELMGVTTKLYEAKNEAKTFLDQISELTEKLEESKRDISELCIAKEALQTQCHEIDEKYVNALEIFEQQSKEQQQKYEAELEELNTSCHDLQSEIERFREAEILHANALEEVKSTAMFEAERYEDNIARLVAECDQMRTNLNRLEGLESKHQEDLAELRKQSASEIEYLRASCDEQSKLQGESKQPFEELKKYVVEMENTHAEEIARLTMECDRLRGEVSMYEDAQNQLAAAAEQENALRAEISQLSEIHETEARRLQLQCDRLQGELSMYIESKDEQEKHFEDYRLKMMEDAAEFESTLTIVKEECTMLKEKLTAMESDMSVTKSQLSESNVKRNTLMDENEELLVQLGGLKENLDAANSALAELDPMRRSNAKNQSDLSAMIEVHTELNNRIQHLEENVHRLEREKGEAVSKIRELESSATDLKSQLDVTNIDNQDRLLAAETEAMNRTTELNQILEQFTALQLQDKETQKIISKQQKTLDEYKERLDVCSSHNEDARRSEQELQEARAMLAAYEQQMKAKDASLQAKNDIVGLLTESERQIQDLEAKLREKTSEIRTMEVTLEALSTKSNAEPTANQLDSLKEEIDALNNALQATRNRLAVKEGDLDELRLQMTELKAISRDEAFLRQEKAPYTADERSHTMVHDTIVRAMKLRRSDEVRATALRRLEEERVASSSALAALQSAVERYYS